MTRTPDDVDETGGDAPRDADAPGSDLPLVDPPAVKGEPEARVHGVLLAAGTSSRYGETNKLLAVEPGTDEPLVRRAARTLLEAALASVTVVTGHEAVRVREAVADLGVRVVNAPDYAEGQSRSVRRGVRAVQESDPAADAVVVALGDMPDVSPRTVDRLIAAYDHGAGSILVAAYGGVRGNPVLFDARHFDALTGVEGDAGGRALFSESEDAVLVETADPGVRRDVDRPGDLESSPG